MKLESRSYSGKIFRPKPEVLFDDQKNLIIIVTPWGDKRDAQICIEFLNNLIHSNSTEDQIYKAVIECHKQFSEKSNKEEYTAGVEICVLQINDELINWVQLGHPSLYLDRDTQSISPLSPQHNLSFEHIDKKIAPPLPKRLLGISPQNQIYSDSFKLKKTDRLIILSHSYLPKKFYQLTKKHRNLEGVSTILSEKDPESPFWLGYLSL